MLLEVAVQPRARRNSVEVVDGAKLRVWVTAAPEGGKANDAVVELLSKRLGVPKGSVRIVRGQRARNKLLSIEALSPKEVLDRLSAP